MTERRGALYGLLIGSFIWLLTRDQIVLQTAIVDVAVPLPFSSYGDLIAAALTAGAFAAWVGSMLRGKALLGTTGNGFVYGLASSYAVLQVVVKYFLHVNL